METTDVQLTKVTELTRQMRQHQQDVVLLGKERRQVLRWLRDNKVPYRVIAEAMGTSEQAIYKDLRWGK